MEIGDILTVKNMALQVGENLISVGAYDTLGQAVEILAENKIGLAIVRDDGGSLIGVLSERDVVNAIGHDGAAGLDKNVRECMTVEVKTCKSTDHPFDVMKMMSKGGFRHMPVVDNGKLQAVISTRDILRFITEHASPQVQAIFWTKISWL